MDLHPEDLLEREIRGELSEAELARLDLHSQQCAVCRLERRARDDFRLDDESPAAEADVARLLASMAGPLALHELHRTAKVSSPMRYVRFVAVAAAVVTMTGLAAAAARWPDVRAVVMPWTASAPAAAMADATPAPKSASHSALHRVAAVVQPAIVEAPAAPPVAADEVAPSAPPPAVVTPPPVAVAAQAASIHHAARPVILASVATNAAPNVGAPIAAAPSPVDGDGDADASTVFRKANAALQAGDHSRAGELYGLLLNRYPSTPEAHASLALFGRMLLDDGNANGALQCFDDYLRKGGALREEVMLGRALAFQRIGPRAAADEARAWSSLIDAYPGSVHTGRARRRLSELARL
jgi:TolA-binding protein